MIAIGFSYCTPRYRPPGVYHVIACLSRGSLQTRRLHDIVRREDLLESEYLTTLLVVVAR